MGEHIAIQDDAKSPGSDGALPYLPGASASHSPATPTLVLDRFYFPHQQTDHDQEDGQVIPASSPLPILALAVVLDLADR
jgi:hypothetical protein